MNEYYTYIMTNRSGTLYVGVTNDLERRVFEHKSKLVRGFTSKYNIDRLIYYEATSDVHAAIAREKRLKGWTRRKKLDLVRSMNPRFTDLSDDWYESIDGRR
jgi:putative endonuclease